MNGVLKLKGGTCIRRKVDIDVVTQGSPANKTSKAPEIRIENQNKGKDPPRCAGSSSVKA